MKIIKKLVSELVPFERNANKHPDEQIDKIARSIQEFGFNNPILIDGENGIIAGHGRFAAVQRLGMTEIDCIELSGMTERQKRAYIIADNKIARGSEFDPITLFEELKFLEDDDFDLSLTGFSDEELNAIFAEKTEKSEVDETTQSLQMISILIRAPISSEDKLRLVCQTLEKIDGVNIDYVCHENG